VQRARSAVVLAVFLRDAENLRALHRFNLASTPP
jgi:hypothetical protein